MSATRLFVLDGAVRRDPAVEQWFDGLPSDLRSMAKKWFSQMHSCGPDVSELLHDGHPTTCIDDLAFGYVNAFTFHVNVGFFLGSALADASGLLEGTGRFMRHVKVRPGVPLNEAALSELIAAAYLGTKALLASR